MSIDERELFDIKEAEARHLVRLDSSKVNIAPPATTARWFRLVGVRLGNGTDDYPTNGDEVQTVERWTPPDMGEDHHLACERNPRSDRKGERQTLALFGRQTSGRRSGGGMSRSMLKML